MKLTNWHALAIEEVLKRLKVDPSLGLSEEEAKKRLAKYGPNEIPRGEKLEPIIILLRQFKNILVYLLVFAIVISVLMGELTDATAISIILTLNVILGFAQEYRAEKAMEMLRKLAAPKARVIREGVEVEVKASEVVPGDIIVLRAGDRVPADARLIESVNLKVDEAILTGESVPVEKTINPLPPKTPVHEMKNMVFMATTVTYGRGLGVIVATGLKTQFGRIAELVRTEEREPTPLQRRIEHLGRVLAVAMSVLVILVFAQIYISGLDIVHALMTSISLAVAAVPEGLPAVLTIALALGVQRMAYRNAIVRRLASVETLGSATVICTDKTGTLTKNEMTVVKIFTNGELIEVTGSGYEPKGEFLKNGKTINPLNDTTMRTLMEVSLLCNDAKLVERDGEWKVIGDPTEGALVVLALKAGLSEMERSKKIRFSEVPFDSIRKRMSTAHILPSGEKVLYLKGAPDVVISLCKYIEEHGSIRPLEENDRRRIMKIISSMAKDALRVLALAYKKLDQSTEKINEKDERDLIFIGLVGMIDPPRPEVFEAVKKAKEAGIKVIMVTGDHKDTAIAIAKLVGILKDEDESAVITGRELDDMNDEELYEKVERIVVYARVSPEHKLRIIKALKRRGHIVAMTGDGVNDAPSVRSADIGIAMGIRGADVTREVADLILADDNFATIVAAVEEGRTIFNNLRKFIRLLLSANWGEIAIVSLASFLRLPVPLTPAQILWINLITDGLPALALGVDPPEPDVMKKPPRDPNEKVYSGMEIFFVVTTLLALVFWTLPFWYVLIVLGRALEEARSTIFTTIILFELLLALQCRSEEKYVFRSIKMLTANKKLLLSVVFSLILHLMVMSIPCLQVLLNVVPLSLELWFIAVLPSLSVLLIHPGMLDTRRVLSTFRRTSRAFS